MKKTLLSIGTLVSTIAPVASVIACGDGDVPGHEAPYSITIIEDANTQKQANVFVDLKGFVSDSYIKEIKSRIAESIAAANKDELTNNNELKYKTMNIIIGDKTVVNYQIIGTTLLINTSPLTSTNGNNLDTIFNLIDTPFDNFINQLKSKEYFNHFFKKEIWENQHYQIDKVNKDEIKRNILKYFGYDDSNPDLIDFDYKVISDKFIDFTITRNNTVANRELHSTGFTNESSNYFDFIEGDVLHMKIVVDSDFSITPRDDSQLIYISKKHPANSYSIPSTGGSPQNFTTQIYKMAKYLLKQNGYDGELVYKYPRANVSAFTELAATTNSASKVFAYGDQGRTFGINQDITSSKLSKYKFAIDFDKKTFKITFGNAVHDQKQWIFGNNGDHLIIDPSHEWSMTFEGTYVLNNNGIGNPIQAVSLVTAEATDGTNTINILESSANTISEIILNDFKFFINK